MEKKHVGKYDKNLDDLIKEFFAYLQEGWIFSGENKWYEGAHPWQVSNNQGVEGLNKEIKQSHTFRRRLDIGELVPVLSRLVHEWSENNDKLLESSRLSMLDGERLSLSLKTKGYQWYMKNKSKQYRSMKISTKNKYMVLEFEEFELGKADSLEKSLKERAKERMANRAVPMLDDFDESMKIRRSCWIVEELDGDFFCDCPKGMKVYLMDTLFPFIFAHL